MNPSFAYHARLNSPEVVPGGWYRRNVGQYEILSYVNHLIALQLSGDWGNVALFARRAAKYLASPKVDSLTPVYLDLVTRFLKQVVAEVRHEGLNEAEAVLLSDAIQVLAGLPGA